MAISPPSDIVLDVARAVEPAGLEAAKATLVRRGGSASASFATEFSRGDLTGSTLEASRVAATPDPYVRFEAMVMQSFVQNMLPDDSEQVYGTGMAGDMWKGLLAEQLGGVIAARGGIGIADKLLRDHYVEGEKLVAVNGVSSGPAKAEADRGHSLTSAMVIELQRKLTSSLISDVTATDDK